MSIKQSTDLMDLFEYDDFECDDHTYQQIAKNKCSTESGVPLSVELSESLSKSQTPVTGQPSGFVKAQEIFLRFDASGTGISKITETISESSSDNSDSHKNEPKKLQNCGKLNSLESNESNDVILITNGDDCVELQYENEFIDPNEPDCELPQSASKRHNSIDNDYEELLFEGNFNPTSVSSFTCFTQPQIKNG